MESKRVVVTGANGFVGRGLCEFLHSRNYQIIAVTRRPCAFLEHLGVRCVNADLGEDEQKWQLALASADCIVHLAARVHRFGNEELQLDDFHRTNVLGSKFVAEQAALAGVKRFIFLSSIKVNGESRSGAYSAEDEELPEDAYGKSKLQAERAIYAVCLRSRIEYVCVRPPLVYGPGVGANFLRLMRLAELNLPLPFRSIRNQRSFVSLQNLASFLEVCVIHAAAANCTWLISDGEDLSTPELLKRIAGCMHRRVLLFPFPVQGLIALARLIHKRREVERLCGSLRVNIHPALYVLNWRPQISVKEGLAQAVTAYVNGQERKCVRRL